MHCEGLVLLHLERRLIALAGPSDVKGCSFSRVKHEIQKDWLVSRSSLANCRGRANQVPMLGEHLVRR